MGYCSAPYYFGGGSSSGGTVTVSADSIAAIAVAVRDVNNTDPAANSLGAAVNAAATGGGGGDGTGTYAINQDGGTGSGGALIQIAVPYTASLVNCSTGCMTFTNASNVGIAGLELSLYLASDYDSNVRNVLAQTTTNASGNWVSSLKANSGTYYLVANTQGDGYQAQQIKIVVP